MTDGSEPAPDTPFADQAFEAAAEAYADTPESWEHAVRAAIASLFELLAAQPERATACLLEEYGVGPQAIERRDRTIARFTVLLQPGVDRRAEASPPVTVEAIGGGIFEIVRGYAHDRRLRALPNAIPEATVVALSPFLGPKAAEELASSTNVQSDR